MRPTPRRSTWSTRRSRACSCQSMPQRHARRRRRTFSQRTQGTRPLPPRSSSSTPQSLRVLVQRLPNFPDEWTLPAYGTDGSAAVDLRNAGETIVLPPLGRHLVPTGLAIALPEGTEAQIRPRSGLALKRGISIINTPCTIDSDYRGENRIPLINFDREPQEIDRQS